MTKKEARLALKTLTSGTLATLTGLKTYDQLDYMLDQKLDRLEHVDVSHCKNWIDVWEALADES